MNEFRHADAVAGRITEDEYEAISEHIFNSQAQGDMLIATSAAQLSRLAIGAANTVLHVVGGLPVWSATLAGLTLTSPTINGTIATTGLTMPAFTLGGAVTIGGQIFNAGAGDAEIDTTAGFKGLIVKSTQDGATGAAVLLQTVSASPAAEDIVGTVYAQGKDSGAANQYYCRFDMMIESPTAPNEAGKMRWLNAVATDWNIAMTLSSAGVLAVDLSGGGAAAQVDLFDQYDDALVLRQGIQQNNRELLADIGVLERKDSGSGYMMRVQPMVRLLAGGIYQSRGLIDELSERLSIVEKKLLELPIGRN